MLNAAVNLDKEKISEMDDQSNNQPEQDSKHIPGIYNYCDRWCERCAFTSRCLNFEMSAEKFGDSDSLDIKNAAFWNKLSEVFQETLTMLKEMAAEQGIDLDSIRIEAHERERRKFDENVVHIITHMAKTYADMVDDCFGAYVEVSEIVEDEAHPGSGSQLAQSSHGKETIALEESLEVIQWYQHQIYVKIRRALSSAQTENSIEELDEFPKDSDGSAKVALIGIDRSISAWGNVLKYFPDLKEKILEIVAHLKSLVYRVEQKFPDARAFVRPGFDENI